MGHFTSIYIYLSTLPLFVLGVLGALCHSNVAHGITCSCKGGGEISRQGEGGRTGAGLGPWVPRPSKAIKTHQITGCCVTLRLYVSDKKSTGFFG